ncbi:MAG: ABC transporter ATP-binding protein/permease [Clostridia bacterium]|nr:ABC transporter ATP-binding protein/permease [Clostridia bacterium]
MKKSLGYLKPYAGTVAAGLIFKFIGSVAELFLPIILKYIIDDVVPTKDMRMLAIFGGAMLGFSLVALFGNIIANRLAAISSGKMTRDLRYDLFKKISYLNSGEVDAFTLPSLVSRLTSDTYYVNQAVARSLRLGVRAPILLIGGVAVTFIIDWRLALVLLACVPVVTFASVLITKRSIPKYAKVQQSGDLAVRAMQENISGVRVIKALSKTQYEEEKFRNINDGLTSAEFNTNRLVALTNPLATLVLNLGLAAVIAVGAVLGAQSGTVLAFLQLFTIILNAMLGMSKIFVSLSQGVASADRVEQVLSADGSMPVLAQDTEKEKSGEYKIEFDGVSFSYNGKESNLQGISFRIKAGQTVGVIGGTGSGKTTLVNLLMRFYDVDKGTVYVDGRDVRTYPAGELRRKFGTAFQNDFLIASTVRENVDYFRGLSDEQIERALKCSCADEFVYGLEGGLEFKLAQKAANLSGGQKQRLLVARALAANPEILILDDSSSALDYATDARLRKGVKQYYPDCTKFIVAQRVSAVRHADLILVLDDGKVIGAGTHSQLLEECEEYAQICAVQTGGEL